jgi:hypothetical protein
MQNAAWKVKGLEVSEVGGHKDCVVCIHFSVTKDSHVFTGDHHVIFSGENFIAFENLTEEIVMGWLNNSLGSHGISKIESKLAEVQPAANVVKDATVEIQLPWVKG